MKVKLIIGFFVILFCNQFNSAQTNISKIGLETGFARNFQYDYGNADLYAIAYGVKVGGYLASNSLEWELTLSYWQDEAKVRLPIQDRFTYSHYSKNIEIHLSYFSSEIIIPLLFVAGFSSSFVNQNYVEGSSQSGHIYPDNSLVRFALDFGTGLYFKVNKKIRLNAVLLTKMPLNSDDNVIYKGWRSKISIGIDYKF